MTLLDFQEGRSLVWRLALTEGASGGIVRTLIQDAEWRNHFVHYKILRNRITKQLETVKRFLLQGGIRPGPRSRGVNEERSCYGSARFHERVAHIFG